MTTPCLVTDRNQCGTRAGPQRRQPFALPPVPFKPTGMESPGELAVHLAFRGAGADGRNGIGDELGENGVEKLGTQGRPG